VTIAPVLATDVTVNGVAVSSGLQPALNLSCFGMTLKGGINFPWQSTCTLDLNLTVQRTLVAGGTFTAALNEQLNVYYVVKVPRYFTLWSSDNGGPYAWFNSSDFPAGQTSVNTSVAAAESSWEYTWLLANESTWWCSAVFHAAVSNYQDSAWFPYTLTLSSTIDATCGAPGQADTLVLNQTMPTMILSRGHHTTAAASLLLLLLLLPALS